MYLIAMLGVLLTVIGLLVIVWYGETRENARLHAEIRQVYAMLGDAIEAAGAKAHVPVRRRERAAAHGENVRPDGLIERSNGDIVDAAGRKIDPEAIYQPEGGPQAMPDG